jgi:hypothetical protein
VTGSVKCEVEQVAVFEYVSWVRDGGILDVMKVHRVKKQWRKKMKVICDFHASKLLQYGEKIVTLML